MLKAGDNTGPNLREASAALRFLIDRRAGKEIAARIGHALPPIVWDSLPRYGERRDTLGTRIMALAGATYVPEHARSSTGASYADGPFYLGSGDLGGDERAPMPVATFDWMLSLTASDMSPRVAGADTVRVLAARMNGIARIRAGADTLTFDLRPLTRHDADSALRSRSLAAERRPIEAVTTGRRGVLWVTQLSGRRKGGTVQVDHWSGWMLLGGDTAGVHAATR
jgi:hypothetical protein